MYVYIIMSPEEPISERRSVTCRIGSHSVTCHPTQVNAPRLNPRRQAGTRFIYPGGIKGWVYAKISYIPKWFSLARRVRQHANVPCCLYVLHNEAKSDNYKHIRTRSIHHNFCNKGGLKLYPRSQYEVKNT